MKPAGLGLQTSWPDLICWPCCWPIWPSWVRIWPQFPSLGLLLTSTCGPASCPLLSPSPQQLLGLRLTLPCPVPWLGWCDRTWWQDPALLDPLGSPRRSWPLGATILPRCHITVLSLHPPSLLSHLQRCCREGASFGSRVVAALEYWLGCIKTSSPSSSRPFSTFKSRGFPCDTTSFPADCILLSYSSFLACLFFCFLFTMALSNTTCFLSPPELCGNACYLPWGFLQTSWDYIQKINLASLCFGLGYCHHCAEVHGKCPWTGKGFSLPLGASGVEGLPL